MPLQLQQKDINMPTHLRLQTTPLPGVFVGERQPVGDHRGWFERLFCLHELESALHNRRIVQVNRSITRTKGCVRGMHYQHPPNAEMKLVTCLRGEVFDVALDLRANSATRLEWHGERLSEHNHKLLVIPEGFAHGFQTLTDDCELIYFHTGAYAPDAEGGLDPLDPALAIAWPLAISERSARDQTHTPIPPDFPGVDV